MRHFYPRPPRGGRHLVLREVVHHAAISIHALREEGDPKQSILSDMQAKISIHALREEGDYMF